MEKEDKEEKEKEDDSVKSLFLSSTFFFHSFRASSKGRAHEHVILDIHYPLLCDNDDCFHVVFIVIVLLSVI